MSTVYFHYGIGKLGSDEVSGEKYFLENMLLEEGDKPKIIFDVGANTDDYSKMILKYFPESKVYSFEPNPNTFKKFIDNFTDKNCLQINIGFGDTVQESSIHSYEDENDSKHASLYEGVITNIHLSKRAVKIPISMNTIDNFCKEQKIEKIDFLKIDTEGYVICY